jgi:hypothetical protein
MAPASHSRKESRMRAIFISYRREDTEGQAGRLFDDLVEQFGKDSVFMDVAGIEPGRDFRRAIDEQVASCGVLLALIGKSWLDAKDESGRRRLDDAMDFVRLETASALKRDIPVIPVLVRGASMPRADQLPPDLADLAYRNAVELTHARWDSDLEVLVKALRPHVQSLQKDVGSAKTEPAARVAGTVGPSSEPGAGGAAPVPAAQSAKQSWRLIVAMSVAAIVVALGGYVGYQQVVKKGNGVTVSRKLPSEVYIQIASDSQRSKAEEIQRALQKKGVSAPGVEKVGGDVKVPRTTEVRYFNENKKDKDAADATVEFLKAQGMSAAHAVPITGKLREGRVEVWFSSTD